MKFHYLCIAKSVKIMSQLLKRKIDTYLCEWKANPAHKPLIVKGARQVGKTASIIAFANANYEHVVAINFVEQPKFKRIFDDGYDVDSIVKNATFLNPELVFVPGKTLIFFDEIQAFPTCATSLKFFCIDGRYDVICSGSLMGINYQEIESNSVGYKEDYEMRSMDFEEFLWARGYTSTFIDGLYLKMIQTKPLSALEMDVMDRLFKEYMVIGGMPEIVNMFVSQANYSNVLQKQRQLLKDYEEDISKYAVGLDKGKIKAVYNHISIFLAKENKRFQITKIAKNARNRDYIGTVEWLNDAGVINVCYCLSVPELPLKGNYDPKAYKIYYADMGLLIASLDEEAQEDVRTNNNFGTYKGALYENVVSDMLVKQGMMLFYYKHENPALEIDFFVRDASSLIPVEVKATTGVSLSMRKMVENEKFADVKFGIKLSHNNIGFNGKFYTFPYFLTFLLRRFLKEQSL